MTEHDTFWKNFWLSAAASALLGLIFLLFLGYASASPDLEDPSPLESARMEAE